MSMVTEEQAHKKWCVFEQAANVDAVCLGSGCMAWRWFDDVSDDGKRCHMKPTALVACTPQTDPGLGRPLHERRGYCGLAGKP